MAGRFRVSRRMVAVLIAVVAPIGLFVAALRVKGEPRPDVLFAAPQVATMPHVPHDGFDNSTWFCPGVPTGGRGLGGHVTIANPLDTSLTGHITVYTDAKGVGSVEQAFEVQPRSTMEIDLRELQSSGLYASAMVELGGGGGIVEQTALHSDGDTTTPCSNSTSDTWYFADNYTLGDSKEDIIVTNPFPDDAILSFSFSSTDATRTPNALQGVPVAPHSVLVVSQDLLAKDEAVYSVTVTASRGKVVAARAQNYAEERRGFSLSLGAPAASTEWWFTGGWKDGANFERFSLYNPSDEDAQVQPVFLGVQDENYSNAADLITVPAGLVVSFSLNDVPSLPTGRHGVSFTSMNGIPFVVEMAVTKKEVTRSVTTVVLGVEQSFVTPGYYRWSTAVGPSTATEDALVVMNLSFNDATVQISALGPGGETPIEGLEGVSIPAGGIISISIPDDAGALGHPLVILGDQPLLVQRLLPRNHNLEGRSASLAMPG
ncbi:MAG TPA: DUF5719 family protein [Ilumatobacteraceae bacterium]|nr:DUF5719 family protein [Ilumatobacteraceae bacterium]